MEISADPFPSSELGTLRLRALQSAAVTVVACTLIRTSWSEGVGFGILPPWGAFFSNLRNCLLLRLQMFFTGVRGLARCSLLQSLSPEEVRPPAPQGHSGYHDLRQEP